MPEIARFRYKIKIDVEDTKTKAKSLGYICRQLEGQPKCKKDFGEGYPLPQYEITNGQLPINTKIEIAPTTTQIFFFGKELLAPPIINCDSIEPFLEKMKALCDQLETTEEIMNKIAVFEDNADRFGRQTRIYTNTPARYRLIIESREITDQLFANIEKVFFNEVDLVYNEMFRGQIIQAKRRLEMLLKEMDFFVKDLIALARETNDPRADKWEANFNKLLNQSKVPNLSNFFACDRFDKVFFA